MRGFTFIGNNTIDVSRAIRYLGIVRSTEEWPTKTGEKIVSFKMGELYTIKEGRGTALYHLRAYDKKKRLLWEEQAPPVRLNKGDKMEVVLSEPRFL